MTKKSDGDTGRSKIEAVLLIVAAVAIILAILAQWALAVVVTFFIGIVVAGITFFARIFL